MQLRHLIVAAALGLSACSAPPEDENLATAPIEFQIKSSRVSQEDLDRALQIFRRACTPLGGAYWRDVEAVRVEVRDEYADHRLGRGWKTEIAIAVVLPDELNVIPSYDDRVGAISGQTLWYNVGGGRSPGILAGKRSAQMLCGMPIGDGEDTFKAVPELSFLDPTSP